MIKVEESLLSNEGVVNVTSHSKHYEDSLYAECKIYENDIPIFEVYHSEESPEDNTLFRNFSDCYNVMCLLEKFYKYGLEGKKITFGMKDAVKEEN